MHHTDHGGSFGQDVPHHGWTVQAQVMLGRRVGVSLRKIGALDTDLRYPQPHRQGSTKLLATSRLHVSVVITGRSMNIGEHKSMSCRHENHGESIREEMLRLGHATKLPDVGLCSDLMSERSKRWLARQPRCLRIVVILAVSSRPAWWTNCPCLLGSVITKPEI